MKAITRTTSTNLTPTAELRRFLIGAFAASWTLWAIALALPQTAEQMPTLLITILGGFAPFLTAVVLLRRHATPEERREVRRRILDVRRISPRWWLLLVAIGLAPAMLARAAPVAHPVTAGITLAGAMTALAFGLIPAVAEELGWRGYALDRIRGPHSPVHAGLALGTIWALWHLPLHLLEGWSNADVLGLRGFPVFAVWIIAQSVVMAVAYYATGRSILSAIVIHLLANSTIALLQLSATEFAIMAAAWTVAAIGVATWNAYRSRQTTFASLH